MKVCKAIEKKSQVLGLGFNEIGLVILLFAILFILGNTLAMFTYVSGWYYLGSLALVVISVMILRFNNRKKRPTYLMSLISFHFFQPKRIYLSNTSRHARSVKRKM